MNSPGGKGGERKRRPTCNRSDRADGSRTLGDTQPERVLTAAGVITGVPHAIAEMNLQDRKGNFAQVGRRAMAKNNVDVAMHATAARNRASDDWRSIDWASANREVARLQQRIFRASQQKQRRKVRSLQKLLLRSESNLVLSVRQVTQVAKGKRTPGVDGRTALTAQARWALVQELRQTPMTRRVPVRRVYIPKANGKQRPLGIPTIEDRARQNVVKTALEPAWEPHFEATSYGFRPGRRTYDAVYLLWTRLNRNGASRWVLDADVRGAYDHISHAFLLQRLGNFPGRWQIKTWLEAGYVEYGTIHSTTEGTPQGGVISPLLANIALDGLRARLNELSRAAIGSRHGAGYFGYARYADDFVVTAPDKGRLEEAVPKIRDWLAVRGLELNEEKTRIVSAYDGFDFLGFTIRKMAPNGKCLTTPQKSKVLAKLRELKGWLHHHRNDRQASIIAHLNPIVRGWANYYRYASSSRVYAYFDARLWQMLWSWCLRRHPTKNRRWIGRRYFGAFGNRSMVFMTERKDRRSRKVPVFLVQAYQRHVAYVPVKGSASPMDPALQDYWDRRRRWKGHHAYGHNRLKHAIGFRQSWRCPVCGDDLLAGDPVDTHHLVRVVDGGTDHPSNLEMRHEACHYNDHWLDDTPVCA